jgi:hypothetical protein
MIMLIAFVTINFAEIPGKEYIPIYLGVFIMLKAGMDLYDIAKRRLKDTN